MKRTYQSPLREEAARVTRGRIRDAAVELFVQNGFVATTMKQVAARAGVAERTVYTAYATKADLFRDAVNVALVGDELPVAILDRGEVRAAMAERDGRQALAQAVTYNVAISERANDLVMVGELSSGADSDMRQFTKEGSRVMAAGMRLFAAALASHRSLRSDVDVDRAADILFFYLSPYTHHLLRRVRGWSAEDFRVWLLDALVRELLPAEEDPPPLSDRPE
ncbi:MAG: TetR/AcrR family transcriptional regulator [Acidimicrobiales bacterium]